MSPALTLLWKQFRFEIVAVVLATLGLVGIVAFVTWQIDATRPSAECVAMTLGSVEDAGACTSAIEAWDAWRYQPDLFSLVGAWPLLAGVILGSVLVSREVEHRTAQLGWSLSGARLRWLTARVVPVAALLLVMLAMLAVAAEVIEGSRYPTIDSRASLDEYGRRALPVVMRGFGLFGVSVLVGAMVGRQLPALLVAGAIAVALAWGLTWAFPYGAAYEWVTVDATTTSDEAQVRNRRDHGGYRTTDGSIITWQEADRLAAEQAGVEIADPLEDRMVTAQETEWIERNLVEVDFTLMGDRLVEIELRESVMLAALGLASLAAAALVVDRRRPY